NRHWIPHTTLTPKKSIRPQDRNAPQFTSSTSIQPLNSPLTRHGPDVIPARAASGWLDFAGGPTSRSYSSSRRTEESRKMMSDFMVIRDSTPATAIPAGTVVAMGNFDGVHLGHRAVIA